MFNMQTIVFNYVALNALVTVFLAILWWQNRRRFAGISIWLLAYSLQTVALLLIALRGVLPDFLSIVVANVLIVAGTWILYIGLERFVGKNTWQTPGLLVPNLLILLVLSGALVYFTYQTPDISGRTLASSLAFLLMTAQCGDLLLRRVETRLKPASLPAGVVFALYSAIALGRAIYLVWDPIPPQLGIFEVSPEQALVIFLYQLLTVALIFTLNMMLSSRLQLEVQEHEARRVQTEMNLETALLDARQRQEETSALLKAAQTIPLQRTFEPAAREIFDICKELIGAQSGYVALLSEDGAENEVLFLEAGGLPCDVDPQLPMPIRGLREVAYRNRAAAYDNDFNHSPWVAYMPQGHVVLENVLFAPLRIQDAGVGLIGLANKPGGFTQRDARIAEAFGDLAAVALKYAKYQDELRESEERFHSMFDKHGATMLLIEPGSGQILDANAAAEEFYGYPLETLKRMTIQEINTLSPEEVAELRQQALQRHLNYFVFPHRLASGEIRSVEVHSTPITIGGQPVLFSVIHDITERKRAEEALRQSNETARAILDAATETVFLMDANGTVLAANETAAARLNLTVENLIGRCMYDLLPASVAQYRKQHVEAVFRDGIPAHFDDQRAGFWMENNIYPIAGPDGRVKNVAIYGNNVTEQKKAETALRASEEKYRTLVEQAADGIFITDSAGNYIDVNPSGCAMMGYARDEILKLNIKDLLSLTEQTATPIRWQELNTGKAVVSERYLLRKDGSLLPVEISAKKLDDGRLQGIVRDITERKRAEDKLRENDLYLRRAQSIGKIGHFSYDPGSKTIEVSDELLRIFGIDREQALLDTFARALHPEDQAGVIPQVMKTISDGTPYDFEYRFTHSSGAARYAHSRGERLDIGGVNKVIGTVQDITERKQAEAALRETQARLLQSEKLASVGQLVAGVAHELNNPLTSVILFSQLIQQKYPDAPIQRDLDKVVTEAQRTARIVRGLLDFARQRKIELKPADLNRLLTGSLELVAYELRTRNIHSELHLDPALPLALVDPYQIQQVCMNLLQNAWQSMTAAHATGKLSLRSETAPSLFSPPGKLAETVIRLSFDDDGPGIPDADLPHIFDPFYTTRPVGQGTGLGLAICHGIIAEHRGHIWAENRPGGGARFVIELPILRDEAEPAAAEAVTLKTPAEGKASILVIDDEAAILESTARVLRYQDYQVDTESDGAAALQRLQRQRYDLILCDVRMPGMSGVEFYQQLQKVPGRGRSPEPMLFITGDAVSPATREFLEETRISYLSKPFDLDQLLRAVSQMLDRS